MKTSTNGQPAEWTDEIKLKWKGATKTWPPDDVTHVTHANYFTPRPYVDEYNRGSKEEGFVYTLNHRRVCQIVIGRSGRG